MASIARGLTINKKSQTLETTHLLCVEPQTKQLFQINMGTQTAEEVQLESGKEITNKIKREEYKMDQLLDRPTHDTQWFFQNETAKNFRQQMVPFYLLEMEANLYPVYVDNSNIDESLTSDFKIHEITIKLSDSIWQTINSHENQMAREGKLSFLGNAGGARTNTMMPPQAKSSLMIQEERKIGNIPIQQSQVRPKTAQVNHYSEFSTFTLRDVSLLTTADKVIKKCEKEIETLLKHSSFSFRDTQNKMQILKFKSVDSYAYGETQLIYFVEIREYLRQRAKDSKFPLELVLISLGADEMQADVPSAAKSKKLKKQNTMHMDNQQQNQFPPLIEQRISQGHATTGSIAEFGSHKLSLGPSDSSVKKIIKPKTSGSMAMNPTIFKKKQIDQVAKKYRNVSIFGWYTPKNFVQQNASYDKTETNGNFSDAMSTMADLSGSNLASASYSQSDKFTISKHKKDHGNVPFLKAYNKGLIPYNADSQILRSCDIRFPLKINLLALRDLALLLRDEALNKKPKQLRMINYCAPYEPQNQDVMDLLKVCQSVSQLQPQSMFRKNMIDPFGNWGCNKNFSQGWQELKFEVEKTKFKPIKKRSGKIFTMKPQYIQVQAALYLGCRRISTFSYSKPTLYGNEIDFGGDFLQFHKPQAKMRLLKQKELDEEMSTPELAGEVLKIDCLPSCARLCFNVILLPEPGSCNVIKSDKVLIEPDEEGRVPQKFVLREGFVLGSCQVSLFDESFLIRQGKRECRLWPFESFMPRMVCQGECYNKKFKNDVYAPNQISECMTMQIEFQSFAGKVGWRLQRAESQKNDRFGNSYAMTQRVANFNSHTLLGKTNDFQTQKTTFENVNLEQETRSLKQVKRLLDAYPMELEEDEEEDLCVEKVLEYRNYIHKMPIFIRLIDFTDHAKIGICYDTLDGSGLAKDMLPEESLALLDGQFGDIKVRIFAVKKLSMLNDSQIALFMPQLIQALKYELFHHSPLAEFLLEKALKNTRVVGHAFFWSLKANLHWPHSRERFYLILERFLMCCGQFKNDFFKQVLVNRSLVNISGKVNSKLDNDGASKEYTKMFMHKELKREEIRIKLMQQLVIAHAKYDDMYFKPDGTRIEPNYHHSSITENDEDSAFNSRRYSGKGSSGGEGPATGGARRLSHKALRSDGGSSQPEQYEFDEKSIEEFIEMKLATIFEKICFPADEYDQGQNQEDDASQRRKEPFKVSPRTQALDSQFNEIFYNRWKVEWQQELLYIPFAPKNPFSSFADKGGSIFMSKKKPLLIVCNLANEKETEASLSNHNSNALDYSKLEGNKAVNEMAHWQNDFEDKQPTVLKKFLFKCGDDLRQDNLVLQFFKIMDRLWQSSGDDLRMMCYDVMETGFETGYIEFIDNATVITQMHKDESFFRGPFREKSVMNFFMDKVATTEEFTKAKDQNTIKQRLAEYNTTFLHSLAGQCVGTYVLGIRDRHPGNFMLHNLTGTFFHIDFGHFLGHGKKKLGFLRDREPFIYSNELHYFLKNMCLVEPRQVMDSDSSLQQEEETKAIAASHNNVENDNVFEGDQASREEIHANRQQIKSYELFFNQDRETDKKDKESGRLRNKRFTPDYFEEFFEKLASQAFLKIRQNADIFINLLVLMLVAGLDELSEQSIGFVKRALFLNVSEEEATVQFKHTIDLARKQWYRPIDNLFHVIQDNRKEKKQRAKEEQAMKRKNTKK